MPWTWITQIQEGKKGMNQWGETNRGGKREGREEWRGGRANGKIGRQGGEERRRPKEDGKMRSVEGKKEEEGGTR